MSTIAERGLAHLKTLYGSEAAVNQEAARQLASKVALRCACILVTLICLLNSCFISSQDITKLNVDAIGMTHYVNYCTGHSFVFYSQRC